jgi:lysophospholipase
MGMSNIPFGFLQARDGIRLRYGHWPHQGKSHRGAVVVLGGRAEFMEKYFETIGELNIRGFDAFSLDWRGQGLSDRMLADRSRGYVSAYGDYVADLKLILDEVVRPNTRGPLILMAHSMGATIVLHSLRRYPRGIDKAVLLSPMIRFRTSPVPYTLAKWYCRLLAGMGRSFSNIPSLRRNDSFQKSFAGNRLTHDETRFDRVRQTIRDNPQLSISGITYGWLAASFEAIETLQQPGFAQGIHTPVLVATAGQDRVVSNAAAKRFVALLPAGHCLSIENAFHEILQEQDGIQAQFWQAFDRFVVH